MRVRSLRKTTLLRCVWQFGNTGEKYDQGLRGLAYFDIYLIR